MIVYVLQIRENGMSSANGLYLFSSVDDAIDTANNLIEEFVNSKYGRVIISHDDMDAGDIDLLNIHGSLSCVLWYKNSRGEQKVEYELTTKELL